jgi:hypothetical protein
VDHAARVVLLGIDIPQLLDADAVNLRLAVRLKIILRLHLLGQVTARAFGKQGILGVDFHAGLVIALVAAIGGNAHVLRDHAGDCAVLVEHHLGGGEAGKHHYAQRFGLLGEPAREIAEAAGVAAVVAHQRRHDRVGEGGLAGLGQHPVPVIRHRGLRHRAAHGAPVGQQFVQ